MIDVSAGVLQGTDLLPFQAGIAARAEMVMVSSAIYRSVGPEPALVSPTLVTDWLRGRLGFRGVVVSDALGGAALVPVGTTAQVAVGAARAGVDLFIGTAPSTCFVVEDAMAAAIRAGQIPLADAQAAYQRMLTLRSHLPPPTR